MNSIKRILTVIFLVMALFAVAAFATACGDQPPETPDPDTPATGCINHIDINKNGECDVCGAEVIVPCENHYDNDEDNICDNSDCQAVINQPVACSIFIKGEDGAAISGIEIQVVRVYKNGFEETVQTSVTDAEGKIGGTLIPGSYKLKCTGLASGWLIKEDGKTHTVSAENSTVTLIAVDNTPDGTENDPFFVGDGDFTATFEAGGVRYYEVKGEMFVEIRNENASLTYNGVTYTPTAGVINVHLDAPKDKFSTTVFSVTNTAEAENEITVTPVAIPGSLGDPYDFTPETEEHATVTRDSTVYYEWVATGTGTVKLYSTTEKNFIYISKVTANDVPVNSDNTEGKVATEDKPYTIELEVTSGDTVRIAVSYRFDPDNTLTDEDDVTEVVFNTLFVPIS